MNQDQNNPAVQPNAFGNVVPQNPTDPIAKGAEPSLDDILKAINEKFPAADKPAATDAVKPDADKPDAVTDPVEAAEIDTGSKALDIAVSTFVKSTGATQADVERAVKNAVAYNDPSLIDVAFLTERFGDRAAEAQAIAEAVVEQAAVQRDALVQAVYSTAGGEEQWRKNLAVYKQHAPEGLQKAIQLMFDSGDAKAVKEAAGLVTEFAKNSGVLAVSGQRMTASSGPAGSQGLSRQEFQQAVAMLKPGSRTYNEDYARLIDLRRLGKQLNR